MLASCASSGDQSQNPATAAPSEAPISPAPSATTAPSPTVAASDASPQPAERVTVDGLAQTAIGNLSVRTEPSTAAERLGLLSGGETALVIAGPVEADGYTWYRLVSPGNVSMEMCFGENPQFRCMSWIGWVAAVTPAGDRWIVPFDPDCRPERDTETYLSMDALTRLACAGDDEWRLIAYLAPSGGRGCLPVWLVDPFWMDPSCAFFFPQPVEAEFDADTSLQGFITPELGACGPGGCPFDELEGSWVEVVGHLDDPVAETCTSVLNASIGMREAPFSPPDPDLTRFICRLNFVVTEVTQTSAPPGS